MTFGADKQPRDQGKYICVKADQNKRNRRGKKEAEGRVKSELKLS